jgi:hypothetical protein
MFVNYFTNINKTNSHFLNYWKQKRRPPQNLPMEILVFGLALSPSMWFCNLCNRLITQVITITSSKLVILIESDRARSASYIDLHLENHNADRLRKKNYD